MIRHSTTLLVHLIRYEGFGIQGFIKTLLSWRTQCVNQTYYALYSAYTYN